MLIFSVLLLTACQSPFLTFPGGELTGMTGESSSFSFAGEFKTLHLEVRPGAPYSVILRVVMLNGKLYIDAAEGRRWHRFLKTDNHVRIKLGKKIYLATANKITDPVVTSEFLEGRTIYELLPR